MKTGFGLIAFLLPYLTSFLADDLRDDLNISFKEALVNDLKNHKVRILLLPISLTLSFLFLTSSFVFLVYGASSWLFDKQEVALVSGATGGGLFVFATLFTYVFYNNISFVVERMEAIKNAIREMKDVSPLKSLYDQMRKERNMFFESLSRRKDSTDKKVYAEKNQQQVFPPPNSRSSSVAPN
jgi:hypothetical protein